MFLTPEYREVHAVWLEGVASYRRVAENMALAIGGPDEALLTQCSQRLGEASAKFGEATRLMELVTAD